MVAGHLGNWEKPSSSQVEMSQCTAVSGTRQARRRNKSDRANWRFATPHSEKALETSEGGGKDSQKKKITPLYSSSILSFPLHNFPSLIFKGPGETFAWRSKRRAEKVMLTFRWLDAESCLVQYERGRIQSKQVGMVFGRADKRDGEGVERRSAAIFLRGETQTISGILKPTRQHLLPQSHKSPSGVDGNFGKQRGANLTSVFWVGESRHDSSSSEMKSMASFWSGCLQ